MTTEQPKSNDTRYFAIRSSCLELAVRSNCGLVYDDDGRNSYNEDEIIRVASKFVSYIKNGLTPEVTPIETKKEGW